MVQVASLAVFALLLARLVGAPRGTWRYVLGAAAAALLASQLLPAGNAFREDVAGSAGTLFWIGLGLIPVAAYAVVLRQLRRRSGVDLPALARHPAGLVQFTDDAALAADTAALLEARTEAALPAEHVSFGWRDEAGALMGHLRLRLAGDLAEIEMLRIEPGPQGPRIAAALLDAATALARERGAQRLGALVGDWQEPGAFAAAGLAQTARLPAGHGRSRDWMERLL